MLKVLLADSEPEAIKILTGYITNYSAECDVVPVPPGARVLGVAEANRPALLIADAEFLGDCAAVAKELYERCPDVKLIVYASINQSEQLQRCMPYDILDYMYKPVKQSEFLRCLQRALDYFRAWEKRRREDSRIAEAYTVERDAYGDLFLRALLSGAYGSDEIADGFRYFRSVLEPDYCVFVMQIDRYSEVAEKMSTEERCLLAFKVRRLIEEGLRGHSFRVLTEDLSAVTVILSGRIPVAQVVDECEKLKQTIFERLEVRVSAGIGACCKSPTGIPVSYREARAALGYRASLGYHSVIPVCVAEPFNSVGYAYPEGAEQRLIAGAVTGAYESCLAALKPIAAALNDTMPVSAVVMDILTRINRRAAERGIDIKFSQVFQLTDIQGIFTAAAANEYLKSALRKICGVVAKTQAKADEAFVARAREYITEHYYETASSAKLAVMLGTTPEYFERVFAEREGMSVYDFAARLRLEEAKSLMRKTSMDDEMIAIKIGYDDVKQFRGEFKNYENMSVREYRMLK